MMLAVRRRGRRSGVPTLDIDLYGRAALAEPDRVNAAIRAAGPAVWLPRNNLYAIGRYADVRAALRGDGVFSSGHGVAANPIANRYSHDTVLCSDSPAHIARRKVMLGSLAPRNIEYLTGTMQTTADGLIDDLVARRTFEAVRDFAGGLPTKVIADLVGVRVGPDQLLRWGRSVFDTLGSTRRMLTAGGTASLGLKRYTDRLTVDQVVPGSWAASVFDAADKGKISAAEARTMVIDFVVPSLDTTIIAATHMLWRLADTAGLWDTLRADPSLVDAAVVESVRLASPVRTFTRYVTTDTEVDGVALPAGSRVAVIFAAANRDPDHFPDPDRFDLTRPPGDQVGWGHGPHACVGMPLAKLEMAALVRAMLPRVGRITTGTPTLMRNSILQGFERLPATFTPA